ncbi:MAG: phosphatase PAP2 family protein [Bacteroidia bacterium]
MKNDFFDSLMPILRDKYTWLPLYAIIVAFVIKNYGLKSLYVLGFAALTFLVADQLSAHVIKPLVQRARPCNDACIRQWVHNLVDCGSGYSFVSSHATNHFAIGMYFITVFARPSNRLWVIPTFLLWASLVAFAQVYVGVHYPFDVIGGAILGIIIGLTFGWLNRFVLCTRCGKKI